jgi:hypothetical protein
MPDHDALKTEIARDPPARERPASDAFVPARVTADEVASMYAEALRQAEAKELSAWVNLVAARAARQAIEADLARLLPPKEGG